MRTTSPCPVIVVPSRWISTASSVSSVRFSLCHARVGARISRPSLDLITTLPLRLTSRLSLSRVPSSLVTVQDPSRENTWITTFRITVMPLLS